MTLYPITYNPHVHLILCFCCGKVSVHLKPGLANLSQAMCELGTRQGQDSSLA